MADENQRSEGAGASSDAGDKVESAMSSARDAASSVRSATDDLRSAAGAMAGQYREKAEDVWNDARYRVQTFQEDAEQYVRENPTKAIFSALGVGFVLGLIFRR